MKVLLSNMVVLIALMSSSVCSLCPVQSVKAQENSWPPISAAWHLILYREAQDPAKTDALRLYFPYERDHKKDSEETLFPVRSLLFSPESDPQENIWYGRSENRQHCVVFPTSQDGKDLHPYQAAGTSSRWYASRRLKPKTDPVFPPGFNRATPDKYLRLITPFSMRRKYHAYYLSNLIPVFPANERDDRDRGIEAVLPGSSSRYPSRAVTFSPLFPGYYHTEDIRSRSDLRYYFSSQVKYCRGEKRSSRLSIFPLFSKSAHSSLQLDPCNEAWPFFHQARSPKTFSVRVLPFFCRISAEDYGLTMIFPLYSSVRYKDYTLTHIIPFYGVHSRGERYIRRFVLAPFIFMDTQDRSRGLFRRDIFFPLFSNIRDGDEGRTWLFPFYYHRYSPDEQLTMGSLALLPPYYFSRKKGADREYCLWPFYGQAHRGLYSEYSTIWPFFRLGRDLKHDIRLTQVFLYYYKAEQQTKLRTVIPFWWHWETSQTIRDFSPLLHWYEKDKEKGEKDIALLWLYPPQVSLIRYHRQPERRQHAVFPLYSYDRSERPDDFRLTLLWPLFSYRSQGEFTRKTGFPWTMISYERTSGEYSDLRFFWRLIRRVKTEDSSIFELNPLYYSKSEKGKGSYWAILGGLLGVETTKDQHKRVRWLWIFG